VRKLKGRDKKHELRNSFILRTTCALTYNVTRGHAGGVYDARARLNPCYLKASRSYFIGRKRHGDGNFTRGGLWRLAYCLVLLGFFFAVAFC
jgi:hypothetical protein